MTAREWIDNELDGEDALVADGLDECIIGVVQIFNKRLVLYDQMKVIAKLVADGMSEDEAVEWYEFNIIGAYMGEGTPAFATLFEPNVHGEERPDV